MINIEYKVKHNHDSIWDVIFSYTANWEDPPGFGSPGDEKEETLYTGTLPECEAYINLHKQGMI